MDSHAQPSELWQFLLPFKIYISDYLKFNSKNYSSSDQIIEINSIQEIKQKTQSISLPCESCRTVMGFIDFYGESR